jgi:ribosome-associated protein
VGNIASETPSAQPKEIAIESEYITLGQFLKFTGIIDQGGMAKSYLASHKVLVNGQDENRRGRKLRPGDKVLLDAGSFVLAAK